MIIHHPIASVSHPWTSQGPVSELKSSYGALSQDRETDGRLTTSRLNKGLCSFFTVLHALLAYIFLIWSFINFFGLICLFLLQMSFFDRQHRESIAIGEDLQASATEVSTLLGGPQGTRWFFRVFKGGFFFGPIFPSDFFANKKDSLKTLAPEHYQECEEPVLVESFSS